MESPPKHILPRKTENAREKQSNSFSFWPWRSFDHNWDGGFDMHLKGFEFITIPHQTKAAY
jgi:hypothetical protein